MTNTPEVWKQITGGWISSYGNAKRYDGRPLTLCRTKFRYRIDKRHQYATRLVAMAFEIDGYERLTKSDGTSDQMWCVGMRDPTMNMPQPGFLENLYIRSKVEIGRQNGRKSRRVNQRKSYEPSDFEHLQRKILADVSENHTVYENGEIWNGKWFLQFSKPTNEKYYSVTNLNGTRKSYKVHRLVCYAFHPIEGYECLDDYKHLQVNHIDGNTLNNHKDNLEWVNQATNMSHAYRSGLNKKTRGVRQYRKGTNNFITEYPSIAEASRQTGERESNIREFANRKRPCHNRIYDWKFTNPEESEEYTAKHSSSYK